MQTLWRDEDATAVVEYALLLALLVLVTVAAWGALGGAVQSTLNASIESISAGQD